MAEREKREKGSDGQPVGEQGITGEGLEGERDWNITNIAEFWTHKFKGQGQLLWSIFRVRTNVDIF